MPVTFVHQVIYQVILILIRGRITRTRAGNLNNKLINPLNNLARSLARSLDRSLDRSLARLIARSLVRYIWASSSGLIWKWSSICLKKWHSMRAELKSFEVIAHSLQIVWSRPFLTNNLVYMFVCVMRQTWLGLNGSKRLKVTAQFELWLNRQC